MRDHRGIDLDQLLTGDLPDPASDEPLLTGTSVEVARRLGVSPLAVRTAFAVTTFASGLGVAVYLACWAVLVRAPAVRRQRLADALGADSRPIVPAALLAPAPPHDPWRTLGLGILVAAGMVTAIAAGWARPSLVWPAMLVGAGVVIAWAPPGEPLARDALRQTAGAGLVLTGLLVLVADRLSWSLLVDGAVTGVVVLVGIALVAGPWMLRSARATAEERRERMRAE
ncbi:MAG: PspC domain-containing protein, partial [Microthrixaceae bacterium]